MSRRKKNRVGNILMHISPWILAFACTLLLVLLTLFTASNYKREKDLVLEALTQKGLTLMRFINSSVRESIRDNLRSQQPWQRWQEHMQFALVQATEQPGVESVLLLDAKGKVLVGSGSNNPEIEETTLEKGSGEFIRGLNPEDPEKFISRTFRDAEGNKKFQLASWFQPPKMLLGQGRQSSRDRLPRRGSMMQMNRRFYSHPEFSSIQQEISRLRGMRPLYLVQLDFEPFNSPLKRQLLQIIILLVLIVLVLIGGVLSFATLKGLKGSQLRLGKMRAFNDILVSSLPIGLIATDSTGSIQVCNGSAAEVIGCHPDTVLGNLPERSLPEPIARMFSGSGEKGKTERQAEIFLEQRAGKGHGKSLQLASVMVHDEGEAFTGEVLLIRDMTEVKHLEKELQRNERLAALGKMAAGVAHELRNPLSSIKGLTLLLKSNFPSASSGAETADILVKEVERLNRSISELLDYARPEQLTREQASIIGIIEKTVSLVRLDAESYNIDIELQVEVTPGQLLIDKDKMNQVFLNLFLNAIQAMEEGGQLLVTVKSIDGEVCITVRDNGHGIESENLARVFDPYFTTKNDGTGLGLAMSAKIIEEHDGRIELASVPGKFTEVTVTLPESS